LNVLVLLEVVVLGVEMMLSVVRNVVVLVGERVAVAVMWENVVIVSVTVVMIAEKSVRQSLLLSPEL
jgi:hypothetical protein